MRMVYWYRLQYIYRRSLNVLLRYYIELPEMTVACKSSSTTRSILQQRIAAPTFVVSMPYLGSLVNGTAAAGDEEQQFHSLLEEVELGKKAMVLATR